MRDSALISLIVTGVGEIEIAQMEKPAVGSQDVLIQVSACGICGTDRHIFHGTYPAALPVSIGHEFAGVVAEVGSDVTKVAFGDLVTVNPNIWCGRCTPCMEGVPHLCTNMKAKGVDLNGGLSSYCVVPESLIYRIAPGTDPVHASLSEPVSCVLHGVDRLEVKAGYTAAVFGGGFIGQIMAQILRLQGASDVMVVEPQEHKRKVAEQAGFKTIDPIRERDKVEALRDLDVTVDCAGAGNVLMQCVQSVKCGGNVLLFAAYPQGKSLPIDPYEIFRKELRIIGSFTYPDTQLRAVRLIESGKLQLDPLITVIRLEQVKELLEGKLDHCVIKGVVKFS
ncbi:MAG: iditol 2-dehydrogenase [Cohnella sp.]|uniref:zinc-dependent alcohol dehydrogenase family protein n=1 Tax=Cohnella sp. TaxID=1883426 RepID=UPI000E38D190|nr:zinc-dependent alcohol dehydrogenase family protein [Cohnella sp.]REK66613.1 MAG: iditol 2-dehydrogenase [Cohnella sp.]